LQIHALEDDPEKACPRTDPGVETVFGNDYAAVNIWLGAF
jgi:hypothetical protein